MIDRDRFWRLLPLFPPVVCSDDVKHTGMSSLVPYGAKSFAA